MSKSKTFFSYSRTDVNFALKLAKDIREAGVDIWIDVLDIRPGSHWDSSIEYALNEANNMIVILSADSVASDNVMDEISYALEYKKRIIPILLNDCKFPFRLRRLQYISFTNDYGYALDQLLETLSHIDGNRYKKPMDPGLKIIEASLDKAIEKGNWAEITKIAKKNGLLIVRSPMIGTILRAAKPGESPFVEIGDQIHFGQTVCIIEAMKLYNEIETEVNGKIIKILFKDNWPVEYDQPLFLVEP